MAIETKNKPTVLDEDASIYSSHKTMKDSEQWRSMNKQEKVTHFKDYYMVPLAIFCTVCFIVGYLIYDAVSNYRDMVLMGTIINDSIDNETLEQFNEDILEYLGYDPDKEKVNIDDDYILSGGNGAETANAAESITSYIYAKQLDVMIADQASFNHYASLGCFYDFKDILTTEQYEKYSKYFYYPELEENISDVTPDGITDNRPTETYPCGIILEDSQVYRSLGGAQTTPVLGIVVTTGRLENTIKLLEYLYPNEE